jgi:hypothetical protein
MKLGKTHLVYVGLFFLASIPAYCQRGTIGLDFGQTSDKSGGAAALTGGVGDFEGEVAVLRGGGKRNRPSVVAGGEIRFPVNSNQHANEFAIYGGPMFRFGSHFSAGFHAQIRKIEVPPVPLNGVTFERLNFKLLELPFVAEYKFSAAPRHTFLRAEISPEFTPHYKAPAPNYPLPNPNFDHGYDIRGIAGYVFGKWYVKATYETRYFKFEPTLGNPNQIYNWRTNVVMGGAGFLF